LIFFREGGFGGEAEEGFEFVPEIAAEDEEADDKDCIEGDVQDNPVVKICGENLGSVSHYIGWN